ncbi:hypothetical protein VNI00_008374 [Paramarasmius palmivorus]|uniref:Uncharacterized protein n=1 Tax=Paramarasmius palmivorus TaxID=297713 RepID=A0AAW0CZN6_9AGAR
MPKEPNASSSSKSPRKTATANQPTSPKRNTRAKKEDLKAWVTYRANNVWQWEGTEPFRHPQGVATRTAKDARVFEDVHPRLTVDDLATIPYEERQNPTTNNTMKLYAVKDLRNLIQLRASFLKIEHHPPSSPFPSSSMPRIVVFTPNPNDPLVLRDTKPGAIINHDYQPLQCDPGLEEIVWDGEHVPLDIGVSHTEACLLYCLDRQDIEDLAAASRFLDLKTVAVRALKVHGGFQRHNEIVVQRRRRQKATIEAAFAASHDSDAGRAQDNHLSKEVHESLRRWSDHDNHIEPAKRSQEEQLRRRRTVKQYAPVAYLDRVGDDFVSNHEWYHGKLLLWEDDLELPDPATAST